MAFFLYSIDSLVLGVVGYIVFKLFQIFYECLDIISFLFV